MQQGHPPRGNRSAPSDPPVDRRRSPFRGGLIVLAYLTLGTALAVMGRSVSPLHQQPATLDLTGLRAGTPLAGALAALIIVGLTATALGLALSFIAYIRERDAWRLRNATGHANPGSDRRRFRRSRHTHAVLPTIALTAIGTAGVVWPAEGLGIVFRNAAALSDIPSLFTGLLLESLLAAALTAAALAGLLRMGAVILRFDHIVADTPPAVVHGPSDPAPSQWARVIVAAAAALIVGYVMTGLLVRNADLGQAFGGVTVGFLIAGLVARLAVPMRPDVAIRQGVWVMLVPALTSVAVFARARLTSWAGLAPDDFLHTLYAGQLPTHFLIPPLVYATLGPLGLWLGWSGAQMLMNSVARGVILEATPEHDASDPQRPDPRTPTTP